MSFDRYRAQVLCENIVGCNNFNDFFNKGHSDIENISLDRTNAYTLSESLKQDAKDLYFKGCISLSESIIGYSKKQFSWAIIKGYYSTFYHIKADFALRDFALIRHRCMYYLKADVGAKPVTKGRSGANRNDYTGDHKSAINYYKDLFSNSDILLSQEIDGLNCYQWIMKKREQVSYQERYFCEPARPSFLAFIDQRINAGEFHQFLKEIENDEKYILTFQPDYASIAIPIKRWELTKRSFQGNGIDQILDEGQLNHLNTFAPYVFK